MRVDGQTRMMLLPDEQREVDLVVYEGVPKNKFGFDQFTREQKLKEIAREIALRRSVYPKWVASGRMKKEEAEQRIAIMLEIAKDYGGHGI